MAQEEREREREAGRLLGGSWRRTGDGGRAGEGVGEEREVGGPLGEREADGRWRRRTIGEREASLGRSAVGERKVERRWGDGVRKWQWRGAVVATCSAFCSDKTGSMAA